MRYETASLLLAGLATPLVLSVHSVISFDFAVAVLPGWHTTIFPPYFVAGAVYSGFAMVITLATGELLNQPDMLAYAKDRFNRLAALTEAERILLEQPIVQ